jgi:hypothetical protein
MAGFEVTLYGRIWVTPEGMDVLHNCGPRIEFFHMYECEKLRGEFRNFTRHQADRKLNALIDVLLPFLRKKRLKEFSAILDWGIYNRTVTGAWGGPQRETAR